MITYRDIYDIVNNSWWSDAKFAADLDKLRPFAKDNASFLSEHDFKALLSILINHAITDVSNPIETLISKINQTLPDFVDVVRSIYQDLNLELSVQDYRAILISLNPSQTAIALAVFYSQRKEALLDMDNDFARDVIRQHHHPIDFVSSLLELHAAGLYSSQNILSLFNATHRRQEMGMYPGLFIAALGQLNSKDLLNADTRELLESNRRPKHTADMIVLLAESHLPLSDFTAVSTHQDPENVALALGMLKQGNSDTPANKEFVRQHPKTLDAARAAIILTKAGQTPLLPVLSKDAMPKEMASMLSIASSSPELKKYQKQLADLAPQKKIFMAEQMTRFAKAHLLDKNAMDYLLKFAGRLQKMPNFNIIQLSKEVLGELYQVTHDKKELNLRLMYFYTKQKGHSTNLFQQPVQPDHTETKKTPSPKR